jgi:hypothetical protein
MPTDDMPFGIGDVIMYKNVITKASLPGKIRFLNGDGIHHTITLKAGGQKAGVRGSELKLVKRKELVRFEVGDCVKYQGGKTIVKKRFWNHPRRHVRSDGYHYSLELNGGIKKSGIKSHELLLLVRAKELENMEAETRIQEEAHAIVEKARTAELEELIELAESELIDRDMHDTQFQEASAMHIQCVWRGGSARRRVGEVSINGGVYDVETNSALMVQCQWRATQARRRMEEIQRGLIAQRHETNAVILQCQWRGGSARRRVREIRESGLETNVYDLETNCAIMVQCQWRGARAREVFASLSDTAALRHHDARRRHGIVAQIVEMVASAGRRIKGIFKGVLHTKHTRRQSRSQRGANIARVIPKTAQAAPAAYALGAARKIMPAAMASEADHGVERSQVSVVSSISIAAPPTLQDTARGGEMMQLTEWDEEAR